MNRPVICVPVCPDSRRTHSRRGYTLVEILIATALTGLLMVGVVEMFAAVGDSVSNSRSILELSGRLRNVQARLQMDLEGITVTMLPPRSPESNEGYAEFREGPIGAVNPRLTFAKGASPVTPDAMIPDLTVNDLDDILMFTTRSKGRPFVGRISGVPGGAGESDVAEVAWFVRGTTLYRRVLLVAPKYVGDAQVGFYLRNDLSAHLEGGMMVANTLADLTRRECRFAHCWDGDDTKNPPTESITEGDPQDNASGWAMVGYPTLGLPTLQECSWDGANPWLAGEQLPLIGLTANGNVDYWDNPLPYDQIDRATGSLVAYPGTRVAEDVILTNVIGFDLQVWDPTAPVISDGNVALGPADEGFADAFGASGWDTVSYGAYVDLGYGKVPFSPGTASGFAHTGHRSSGLNRDLSLAVPRVSAIYDTWSTHYEHDGVDQHDDGYVDWASDGFDNDGLNGVDDAGERETSPPYPVPLRGIRVKIRAFEPDSRQIREVTVVQDFLPK